ncbi:MFS transporter [Sphaerisporangium rufum]|uniref:MFS transporter n=1 Tax=Sphaerisporangium rufum TaxID=1381558 RepID=A0A919R2T9_9ACTN|nr:MFS transporter [Sphaerisporangium rufum]
MIESPAAAPSGVFGRPYRALSTGMVALVFLMAFEYLAVATAMPAVARELDGLALFGLAFSGSMAAGVIATVAGGRWSDVRGPVAPAWAGVGAFVAGLLVAGFAPTMHILVAGRFVQGVGAGLFSVALYVLVAQVYPPAMHPKVFSLLAAAWVLPSLVGPAVSGIVVEHAGWRWVFLGVALVSLPAALVLWRGLAGRPTAPRDEPAAPPAGRFAVRLAWGGMVAAGATLLQYGGGLGTSGLPLLLAGLAVLAVALPRLLPAGTMRSVRGFPSVVLLRGLTAGAFFAGDAFVPLMLTTSRDLSATQAGLFLTGGALSWSLASWVQGRRPGNRRLLLRGGTALIAVGVAGAATPALSAVPLAVGFVAWLIAGFGMGLVYPTLSVLTLELSAAGEEGRNSSSLQIGESVFAVVVLAVTGAVFAAAGTAGWVFLACFAVILVPALLGALAAGRARG